MARENLSTDVRKTLCDQIVVGKREPGTRLNEVQLAKELDVSRTPLREALYGLVSAGLVEEVPRRGFFVSGFSVREIEQLYSVRQILDPAALKMAGIPNASTIKKLKSLNSKIASERKPLRIIDLDDQWHLLLIQGCNNEILLDLIQQHMLRTRRYEYAYFSQGANISVATDEHDLIIDALENNKLSMACKFLIQNMTSAESPLLDWVREYESKQERP